jgi:dTDP-4-dehydrorhamnose reductase
VKLLLTGALGLLGLELLRQVPAGWQVTATLHNHLDPPSVRGNVRAIPLDITDREQVRNVMEAIEPDIVIHTASIGDLEYCERNPAECIRVNVEGTRNLLELSAPYQPLFVFLSTIYVFDGANPPYDESSLPNPINCYARSKLAGEQLVLEHSANPVVLRPQTFYGWHHPNQRANCVTWLLDRLGRGEPVKLVDDVYNNFLWVGDAARIVLAAAQSSARGIFHIASNETCSRYDFSLQVADIFGHDRQLIAPVSIDFFSSLAPRPRDTSCSTQKMEETFGIIPHPIRQGLQRMKQQVNEHVAPEPLGPEGR